MPNLDQRTVLREIIIPKVDTDGSVESPRDGVRLTNDEDSPGANKVYGTDASGVKGWKDDPAAGSSAAEDVTFTASGDIAATDVQAAIEELDSEKMSASATASDITFTPAGSIEATDVQAAIEEVSTDVGNKYEAIAAVTLSGANTKTGTAFPAPSIYVLGQQFLLFNATANTGAVTLNLNGLGAKAVTKYGTNALVSGDMAALRFYWVVYDGTQFQIIDSPIDGRYTPITRTIAGVDLQDNITAAELRTALAPIAILPFHVGGTPLVLTNQPDSEQYLGNTGYITAGFDATNYTQVRVTCRVGVGSVSANSPRLYPQYSINDGTDWITIGTGTGSESASLTNTGTVKSDWITLPAGAKADVVFRIASNGGNGTADPALSAAFLQFRM